MAEQNRHAAWPALLAKVRELRRQVDSLRRVHARAEERFDSVDQDLAAVEDAISAACGGTPASKTPTPPAKRKPPDSSHLLELAAQSGVAKVEIKRLASGGALVRVDGGRAFRLSPTLSHLLDILALDNGKPDGELVGWKSFADVTSHFQKRLGRTFRPHAIQQLVYRLRSGLAINGGVNPFLVQTHRQFGLRFALRKHSRLTPL